jgi:hypothetical protein
MPVELHSGMVGKTDELDTNPTIPIDIRVALKLNQVYDKYISNRLEFGLTFKRLKQMMQQQTCFYTGVKFDINVPLMRRSLDRIDSTKGYTNDNVVACTSFINSLKGSLTYDQIKAMYRGVTKFRRRQDLNTKKVRADPSGKSQKKAKLVVKHLKRA